MCQHSMCQHALQKEDLDLQCIHIYIYYLAKLKYFTNLDFPEIAGDFPSSDPQNPSHGILLVIPSMTPKETTQPICSYVIFTYMNGLNVWDM